MTKKLFPVFFAILTLFTLAGCKKELDYFNYVSEYRSEIYLYEDDNISLKVYYSDKEQPYAADGYCGEKCGLCEIFLQLPKNPEQVFVSLEGQEGEMNYQAVENRFYLCFTALPVVKDGIEVTVKCDDGEPSVYGLNSVKQGSKILNGKEALKCAREYDAQTFDSLTQNGLFNGEIFIRLLHDDGCYYYVGVCDKEKNITAYLIDGERGKIIAKKQLPA